MSAQNNQHPIGAGQRCLLSSQCSLAPILSSHPKSRKKQLHHAQHLARGVSCCAPAAAFAQMSSSLQCQTAPCYPVSVGQSLQELTFVQVGTPLMSFSMGEVSASGPFFTCSSPLSGFRCSRVQCRFKSWYAHGKNIHYSSLARSHCQSGLVPLSIQSLICGRSLTHVMYSRDGMAATQ